MWIKAIILPIALSVPLVVSQTPWKNDESITKEQRGWMVWDNTCISDLTRNEKTRVVAPMVNGMPDMKQANLEGALVTFDHNCGRIVITKGERP